jgi:hypothetical protein
MKSKARAGAEDTAEYETLVKHLLRRINDADDRIARMQHMQNVQENLERLTQHSLDTEAFIELYNRAHPEAPQADLADLLRLECGDCLNARAIRDKAIQQEGLASAQNK